MWEESLRSMPALRPLLDEFSAERIWKVGLEVLGFPPTWAPSINDLMKVKEALRKECDHE